MPIPLRFILILVSTLLASCDPMNADFPAQQSAVSYTANSITPPPVYAGSVKVMTWNIKFGGGRIDFFHDCYGDRILMQRSEVISNMANLAAYIDDPAVKPDIIFLQEADVLSKHSAYVDQVQYLLDNTGMNYAVYASQWRVDLVPSDGIGKTDSGNAILSRWPLSNGVRHALPLIGTMPAYERYFYLRRNYLTAEVTPNVTPLYLLNTHTTAYAEDDTRKRQLDQILAAAMAHDTAEHTLVFGGDLNTIPGIEAQRTGFNDQVCTDARFPPADFTGEEAWMNGYYAFYPAVTLANYGASPGSYHTHTVDNNIAPRTGFWNRKLDYLFSNAVLSGTETHQTQGAKVHDPMTLSDHAPITTIVPLP